MPRHIDADLIDLTKYKIGRSLATDWIDIEDVKRAIALTPTADVVPKSKIAEIFEEIENIAILNGYISVSDFYTDHPMLAELKKKYTEDA